MTTDPMLIANLLGTFVFALSGAVAATRHRLDLFGVLVLSFAAANSGGIVRDLLIGAVPPVASGSSRILAFFHSSVRPATIFVSHGPGAIVLARTLCADTSRASDLVKAMTPAFAAA